MTGIHMDNYAIQSDDFIRGQSHIPHFAPINYIVIVTIEIHSCHETCKTT